MESDFVEVEIEVMATTGSGDCHGIAGGETAKPHLAGPLTGRNGAAGPDEPGGSDRLQLSPSTHFVSFAQSLLYRGAGLVVTGLAVLTPLLQALSMLAGDLVTMSCAADRATPAAYPNTWRVRKIAVLAGIRID
jgi:hypothetical protein